MVRKHTRVRAVLRITSEQVVLGRASDSDLRLEDDLVSRRHLRLWLGPHGLCLEDLDSRNGTFLNGCPISRQVMQEEDEVKLGDTTLKFTYEEPAREMWEILEQASKPDHHLSWVRISATDDDQTPLPPGPDPDAETEEMSQISLRRVANLHY